MDAFGQGACLQQVRPSEIGVQRQAAHQRAVDEQLDGRHGVATSMAAGTGAASISSAGFRTAR